MKLAVFILYIFYIIKHKDKNKDEYNVLQTIVRMIKTIFFWRYTSPCAELYCRIVEPVPVPFLLLYLLVQCFFSENFFVPRVSVYFSPRKFSTPVYWSLFMWKNLLSEYNCVNNNCNENWSSIVSCLLWVI